MKGDNKPPLTNYTYESLQRALYHNNTVEKINKQVKDDMKAIDGFNAFLMRTIKCKTY